MNKRGQAFFDSALEYLTRSFDRLDYWPKSMSEKERDKAKAQLEKVKGSTALINWMNKFLTIEQRAKLRTSCRQIEHRTKHLTHSVTLTHEAFEVINKICVTHDMSPSEVVIKFLKDDLNDSFIL